MAESTIITGQFVRISQTPASIGERFLALVIDYILIGLYVYSTATLLSKFQVSSDFTMIVFFAVIYLPVLFYAFLCEMFNHGQSLGKKLMNIRVVKADGSTPSIGSYLLRWLLFPIDIPVTGGLGVLVILLTKNSQRMGDLAAGTMVIKDKNYRKIHVSLDEFDYLTKDYPPHISASRRLITGTGKCNHPDFAIREKGPCTAHRAACQKSAGNSFNHTPGWRTGTIPANHTPGLSILCIGRNLNFLSIKLNLPYSAVLMHIDSEKLYIRLQNISRNKMDLNSRPYTSLPKQRTCFVTIKQLPSSFLSGE